MIASRSSTSTTPLGDGCGAMSAGQQRLFASLTQMLSHDDWQQNGSTVQTVSQQAELLQKGISCETKQLPVAVPPQEAHRAIALFAHWLSHSMLQQKGSMLHTASQHVALLHALLLCGVRQLPAPAPPQLAQIWPASLAQRLSQ